MAKPLKERNAARLLSVVALNLVIYATFWATDWRQLIREANELLPAALGMALLTVLNGLVGPHTKARLVFWRWKNPLPGSRAFTAHARHDPRINLQSLRRKLGTLPENEDEQNSTWYELYRSVESEPAVAHNHRDYLFTRDYTALSALFLLVLGMAGMYQFEDLTKSVFYIIILVTQYLIVRYVAARYGQRFVATVLAIKSAEG